MRCHLDHPLYFIYASLIDMKTSDIVRFRGNMFQLEKGDGIYKFNDEDVVEFKFGGVETFFNFLTLLEDTDV